MAHAEVEGEVQRTLLGVIRWWSDRKAADAAELVEVAAWFIAVREADVPDFAVRTVRPAPRYEVVTRPTGAHRRPGRWTRWRAC
jgi:hypothetical protein